MPESGTGRTQLNCWQEITGLAVLTPPRPVGTELAVKILVSLSSHTVATCKTCIRLGDILKLMPETVFTSHKTWTALKLRFPAKLTLLAEKGLASKWYGKPAGKFSTRAHGKGALF